MQQSTKIIILENRPALQQVWERFLGAYSPASMHFYSNFNDFQKALSENSFCILASHLLPSQVPISIEKKGVRNLVYGENFTPTCVQWWIHRGASGLWDLNDSLDDLKSCLETVMEGGTAQSQSIRKILGSTDPRFGLHKLSKREFQVAQLLVRGHSTREVAKQLGTTEGTIKNQRKAVYKKLGIVRATQLPIAMGNGYSYSRT